MKYNKPKKCPLACWDKDKDFEKEKNLVEDINKVNCKCFVPEYMLRYCLHPNASGDCPEVFSNAPNYTFCKIFSEWWWKGKKKRINNSKRKPVDSRLRHEVFKRDGYKCVECGATNMDKVLHADHILPVSQGGKDELNNLQTLCEDCNLAKSNKNWKGGQK